MWALSGKVAVVTGAARGLGRAYALKLAQQGADVVVVDACAPIASAAYPMATVQDLEQTAWLVAEQGRRVMTARVDVRDLAGLEQMAADAVTELGAIDIVVTNAGMVSTAPTQALSGEFFDELIDINLSGTWRTIRATVPHMIEAARSS